MKTKPLALFNGRGFDNRGTSSLSICAKGVMHAAKLFCEAYQKFHGYSRPIEKIDIARAYREISVYFSPCWGKSMEDIIPEIGVWIVLNEHTAERIRKRLI